MWGGGARPWRPLGSANDQVLAVNGERHTTSAQIRRQAAAAMTETWVIAVRGECVTMEPDRSVAVFHERLVVLQDFEAQTHDYKIDIFSSDESKANDTHKSPFIIRYISIEVNITDEWHKASAPFLVATVIVIRVFVVIFSTEFTGQISI